MLGTLLNGRYKLVRVLGSGGFGQTYVAEDTQQPGSSWCVVKQFKPARQDSSFLEVARRLFFSEAEMLRRLGSHDQIPALLADFEENREFYLVQEYIEGQPLSEELAIVERLPESEVVALLEDVLHVLEFVHRHHVIHRDIKPGNLIRRQHDRKFVLIDFGAVKEIQTHLTLAGEPTNYTVGIGTEGYGPSEQMMGKPRYNSDLYALGMTAIHALTGYQPAQLPTHPDTGEIIWRDQASASPKLAAILDKMVRYHFNQRFQSATEVLRALAQPLADLADADATRLEVADDPTLLDTRLASDRVGSADRTVQLPPIRVKLRQRFVRASLTVGVASLVVSGFLLGMRQIGWLHPLEVAVFDRLVQLRPDVGPDPRLLVVSITDADIQQQQRFPLSDRTIAQIIRRLQQYQPQVIGLDLLRDIPQEPGRTELLTELKAPNLMAIANLGSAGVPPTPAPPGVPADRVGFNDLAVDDDNVIRRNLLFGDDGTRTVFSFSWRLAFAYLAKQPAVKLTQPDATTIHLGKAVLKPLERNSGGYQAIDAKGYQILLHYRGRQVAREISVSAVLNGKLQPEWVKDKIVLIGTTAVSARDLFLTPFSSTLQETPKMPGVMVHAHSVSQLLSAALEGTALFWYWAEWVEVLWICTWAGLGGSLAAWIRRPIVLGLSGTALLLVLGATGYGIFLQRGWVPIAVPALAATATGGVVIAYRAYGMQRA
jgi:CHASE2 domain-containing sensor protein/predicted Ser/Thr protein kinase